VPALVSRGAGVAERYPPALAGLLLGQPDDAGELARRVSDWLSNRDTARGALDEFSAALRGTTWNDMARRMVALAEASEQGLPAA
jgi:hypothetical protein